MSAIEWTDQTWNPIRGCSIVSKGCKNCYAMKQAHRFSGPGGPYEGLTTLTNGGPVWSDGVRLVPELLDAPLKWKKPRRVFVNSMSDLFHGAVPDEFIDRVFAVMALCPQHTFQILTKRPKRMRDYLLVVQDDDKDMQRWANHMDQSDRIRLPAGRSFPRYPEEWPLRNVWLGVSCEDQMAADERIPLLLETPAAVRFVSAEPLLEETTIFDLYGPVDVPDGMPSPLHWVIVGGESGPGARPCDVAWIESIVDQCKAASVPVFVKQLGAFPYATFDPPAVLSGTSKSPNGITIARAGALAITDRKGGDMSEWPADLRVRDMPR